MDVLTALMILLLVPVIYFMWMLFFQSADLKAKIKSLYQEEEPDLIPKTAHIKSKNPHQFPPKPKLYNFVTAEEYLEELRNPKLPQRRRREIIEQIADTQGVIRQEQQNELRHLLQDLSQSIDDDSHLALLNALKQIDKATLID